MSLQKNFPRDRKYYFWAIFLSHLVATDDASSDGERKLFGTLAYRMISKAADDVPTNSVRLCYVWFYIPRYWSNLLNDSVN